MDTLSGEATLSFSFLLISAELSSLRRIAPRSKFFPSREDTIFE